MIIEKLAGQVERASANEAARTVEMLWYSGAEVPRYDPWRDEEFFLAFSMEPKSVRLDRLRSGAPLINSHLRFDLSGVIGVIENPRIENGKGYATARFSERDDVTPIWNDVQAGIIQNVSMGVKAYQLEDVTPKKEAVKHFLATDWEPEEVSVVAVGADPNARFLMSGEFSTRAEYLEFQQRRQTLSGSGAAAAVTRPPDYYRWSIQLRRARLRALSA